MKYILVEATKSDCFTEEFNNKKEAIKEADYKFNQLTKFDLKSIREFYVLKSVNPDEEAENHFDGDIVKRYM